MDNSKLNNLSLTNEEQDVLNRITKGEQMMGNNLIIPFDPNNSGSRKLMAFNQTTQTVNTVVPYVPYISTGYETLFGEKSSSHVVAECDYDVIAILHKFDENPKIHYYLLVKESDSDNYDIIERVEAIHTCEVYGYKMNNKYLDSKVVGTRQIKKGDIIKKSNSFDEFGNRAGGANLLCAYIQNTGNEEDSIIISEKAREKLQYQKVHEINIIINENDIPLNMYGDDYNYKIMPDAGEEVVDGILLCNRRIVNNEILFSQSNDRLKSPQVSDDKYYVSGQVVDIRVECNNPELLNSRYYSQLKKYYNYSLNFSKSVVDSVENFVKTNPNYKMSFALDKLYCNSKRLINGASIIYNDKRFSNMLVTILVLETKKCGSVDKLSDRFGGKGEIGEIRPTELMPCLEDGTPIDIILNPPSIIKRQNLGTIIEPTINMASRIILNHIKERGKEAYNGKYDLFTKQWVDDSLELIADFFYIISPDGNYIEFCDMMADIESFNYSDEHSDKLKLDFLLSILEDDCIYITTDPYTSVDLNYLKELKDFLPEIEDQYIYYKSYDSNGNIKITKGRRPITVGHKYMYIMKQIGSIDHSAVSLSSTGIKNDNVKSGNKKLYKSPIKETPIRFGDMEIMNLIHFSKQIYYMMTLYSSSPQARRSMKDILSADNIFDINLTLNEKFRNRNVEILNAYLSTMGLKLKIKKSGNEIKKLTMYNLDIWNLNEQITDENSLFKIKTYQDFSDDLNFTVRTVDGIDIFFESNKVKDFKLFKFNPSLLDNDKKGE